MRLSLQSTCSFVYPPHFLLFSPSPPFSSLWRQRLYATCKSQCPEVLKLIFPSTSGTCHVCVLICSCDFYCMMAFWEVLALCRWSYFWHSGQTCYVLLQGDCEPSTLHTDLLFICCHPSFTFLTGWVFNRTFLSPDFQSPLFQRKTYSPSPYRFLQLSY